MSDISTSNTQIAKNTILLYIRTLFVLIINLYISRVVLDALGVSDYGIYNVVGGVVSMFTVISGALSNSISRFITFELGHGDKNKLNEVFSTSINIQILLSVVIVVLVELVGVWFLNQKMNIPEERLIAANWVLQTSLAVFVINLISLPYNACIVAHEHMGAFAMVSIVEVLMRLGAIFIVKFLPSDRLITYAILLAFVAIFIRILYGWYCNKNFEESHYRYSKNVELFKEMIGFAGWSFLTNMTYVFNTQGVNILINMYFGVVMNAARGVASQVENAVVQFVNNFTTALNPQITKSYAAGHSENMFFLICKGAKFSYFLLLIFALPFCFETEYILNLWLTNVPDHAAAFIRLSFLGSMMTVIGKTGFTACMATGKIKKYVLIISAINVFVFIGTWMAYNLGAPVEASYIIFAVVYFIVEVARLFLMREMINFPPSLFITQVVNYAFVVSVASIIIPLIIYLLLPTSVFRFVMVTLACIICSCSSVYMLGLSKNEKELINSKISSVYKRIL